MNYNEYLALQIDEKIDTSKMSEPQKQEMIKRKIEMNLNIDKLKMNFYGKYVPEKRKLFNDRIRKNREALMNLNNKK